MTTTPKSPRNRRTMTPYFILVNLLYQQKPWINRLSGNRINLFTAEMGRDLNLTPIAIWPALFALQDVGLVELVARGRVRGIAEITLKAQPPFPQSQA